MLLWPTLCILHRTEVYLASSLNFQKVMLLLWFLLLFFFSNICGTVARNILTVAQADSLIHYTLKITSQLAKCFQFGKWRKYVMKCCLWCTSQNSSFSGSFYQLPSSVMLQYIVEHGCVRKFAYIWPVLLTHLAQTYCIKVTLKQRYILLKIW